MTLGGQGLARLDGKVCFIDRVIPDEIVRMEIAEEKPDYYLGRAREIVQPSPDRVAPACPIYHRCGGCQFQHISYSRQLQLKQEVFQETMKRIGKIEIPGVAIIDGAAAGYRNRAQLPVQGQPPKIGYYKTGTHQVVDQVACPVNHPRINEILAVLRPRLLHAGINGYDEKRHAGELRHIIIKTGVNTEESFVTFVATQKTIPAALYADLPQCQPGLAGVTLNLNPGRTNRILGRQTVRLWGRDYYEEVVAGMRFRIGSQSFFQVNIPMLEKILDTIVNLRPWTGQEKVLDLYAGLGVLGMSLCGRVKEVTAVEESQVMVAEGMAAARQNQCHNLRFVTGDAAVRIKDFARIDLVIMDPPRRGVEPAVCQALAATDNRILLYLSCNPATLARDAALLQAGGYRLEQALIFDMFPQTYHIESLTIFTKD